MVRSLSDLGRTRGKVALYLLLREVWACVWDCLARCTSIAIAALLGYGYHLSQLMQLEHGVDDEATVCIMKYILIAYHLLESSLGAYLQWLSK